MARPQKPHECSWTDPTTGKRKIVPGLYRCPDGRWRINATRKKFTEPDERRAVARFEEMQRGSQQLVDLIVPCDPDGDDLENALLAADTQTVAIDVPRSRHLPVNVRRSIPATQFWAGLRELLINRPEYVARMTGIPELIGLRQTSLQQDPIRIHEIIEIYRRENPSTDKSKREAIAVLNRLIEFTKAKMLDDLTQENLMDFRRTIESAGTLKSAATRAAYYGRIKSIISFGLKVGMDQAQIRSALDRCKVLWTAEALPPVQPKPISRDDFHKLLNTGNGSWRPWLLVGLNLCMSIEEVCGLKWSDFNLERGTYAAIRTKTRRARIPRAAVLWPETTAELKKLPRRGPYVFISTHGTRYNKNTRVNDFKELRQAAELPDSVSFGCLRDGAYTTACQATTDERWARVLAGHTSPGLQDNYVLRNPEAVRPACEAVHRAYGPFPLKH